MTLASRTTAGATNAGSEAQTVTVVLTRLTLAGDHVFGLEMVAFRSFNQYDEFIDA